MSASAHRPAADDIAEALGICIALSALAPAPTVERYLAAGFEPMRRYLGARGGFIVLASKRDRGPNDPVDGWRVDVYYRCGRGSEQELQRADELIQSDSYIHDPGIQRTVREAGRHRIYHDPDPRCDPGQAQSLEAELWTAIGLVDRMKLVYALEPTLEIHFSFDRGAGEVPFEARDEERLRALIGGLRPWCRRIALLHGRLPEGAVLSARERDLACALLGQAPLKNVADALGVGEARARELASGVYRKLCVDGRLGLAQAWAGEHEDAELPPISRPLLRRRRR